MKISQICIKNFKSLKNIKLNFDDEKGNVQCIIGKNGSGKSNILDAIHYFYSMLQEDRNININIDSNNKYIQKMQIEIVYDIKNLHMQNSNDYLDNLITNLDPYTKEDKVLLRLTQYKDGTLSWYPSEKIIRKTLFKLFPVYLVDTRFITLKDWSKAWDIIGDLSISTTKIDEKEIIDKLDEVFEEIYGDKYKKVIHKIEDILSNERIEVNKNFNTRFISALKTRLGGNEFFSDEESLEYHSDGTNSLKYIKFIFQLICYLTDTGWRAPLVIIDEPEIGLHPEYIEDLVHSIDSNLTSRVNLLLTSHSPTLVTSMIKNNKEISINRVILENNYTKLEKIREFVESNDIFLLSNKETECYFSNAVVFVEGATEMQVFQSPLIRNLYKNLRHIKFFSVDSNDASLKLIHPHYNQYSIPFFLLVDRDKILKYNIYTEKFSIRPDDLVNPLFSREIIKKQKFLYYKKYNEKFYTHNNYNIISKILKENVFELSDNLNIKNNWLYKILTTRIDIFCYYNGVYPLLTTIEGALINIDNYLIVLEWISDLMHIQYISDLNNLLSLNPDPNYKTTILRIILNGKFENQTTLNEYNEIALKKDKVNGGLTKTVKEVLEPLNEDIIEKLQKLRGRWNKTDGWINKFLQYYTDKYLRPLTSDDDRIKLFSKHFKELNKVLQICENMLK